jgi:hydrogenase-4 membrane subunit HyfE
MGLFFDSLYSGISSLYICKQENYHCHYAIYGCQSNELLSVNMFHKHKL